MSPLLGLNLLISRLQQSMQQTRHGRIKIVCRNGIFLKNIIRLSKDIEALKIYRGKDMFVNLEQAIIDRRRQDFAHRSRRIVTGSIAKGKWIAGTTPYFITEQGALLPR